MGYGTERSLVRNRSRQVHLLQSHRQQHVALARPQPHALSQRRIRRRPATLTTGLIFFASFHPSSDKVTAPSPLRKHGGPLAAPTPTSTIPVGRPFPRPPLPTPGRAQHILRNQRFQLATVAAMVSPRCEALAGLLILLCQNGSGLPSDCGADSPSRMGRPPVALPPGSSLPERHRTAAHRE